MESILYLSHVIPLARKRALALHPTSAGAAAAFPPEQQLAAFRLTGSGEKCCTWLCSPPPHPMPSRVACCSPVRSLPKGEEVQVHPSSSCRNGGSISHAGCYMAGFHGSGCPSRGCALSLFICPERGSVGCYRTPGFFTCPS